MEGAINNTGWTAQPEVDLTDAANSAVMRDNWIPGTPLIYFLHASGTCTAIANGPLNYPSSINNKTAITFIRNHVFASTSTPHDTRKSILTWSVKSGTLVSGNNYIFDIYSQTGCLIFLGMNLLGTDYTGGTTVGGSSGVFPMFGMICQ
jgi:hypothetical protein